MQFGNHTPVETRDRGTRRPGTRWKFAFPNGFGASVINDGYGREQGLYELAVLRDGEITYETPLTDDVLGYQTAEDIAAALDRIAALTQESVIQAQIDRENQQRDERIAELRAELERLETEKVEATR